MEVFTAHEKHGTSVYDSALAILCDRLSEGYWYDNWDDGNKRHQWRDRAEKIANAAAEGHPKAEAVAERFLMERCDHEYEYVEKTTVQS